MAKFVKIQLNSPISTEQVWRLILETEEDTTKYCKLDANLNISSYLSTDFETHPQGRGANMKALIEIKALGLSEGETISPLLAIDAIINEKHNTFLKHVRDGKILCVNHMGGYCFLDGFLDSYNATVIETIIKEDFGFPIEKEIISSKFLILENDEKPYAQGYLRNYIEDNNVTDYKVLHRLRETDLSYVVKGIQNAETIGVHSAFMDTEQVNKFIDLFLSDAIKPKEILISSYNSNDLDRLKNHELFTECSAKHTIKFLTRK